jgi:hypothetical protein
MLLKLATRDSHPKGLTTAEHNAATASYHRLSSQRSDYSIKFTVSLPVISIYCVCDIARAVKDSQYCDLCVDQKSIKTHVPLPRAPRGCGLAMTCKLVYLKY